MGGSHIYVQLDVWAPIQENKSKKEVLYLCGKSLE